MNEAEKQKTLIELKDFCENLKSYSRLLEPDKKHSEGSKRYRDSLREKLQRNIGNHKDIITQLTGKQYYKQFGTTSEIWADGLRTSGYLSSIRFALTMCIDVTNEAIGKLESMLLTKSELGEVGVTQIPKDTGEVPDSLFDKIQFHPKVVEVSKDCFIAGNYREAILNAFICLIDYVKERTGLDLDGDDLMNQVFSINYDKEQRRITKYPIIRINELQNRSDRDEQQGFMFLCKGAAGGIRNPKAHKLIPQSNPLHTLEYLAFASLLMRRIEEGKVVRTNQPRRKWDWDSFIKDTKEKCEQKIIDLTKNLYDFTSVNSNSISWGTGINDGSFTFRKLSINGEISIFSVYSCGWVYINFGSMINKTVPDNIIETFRTSLNSIPNINIPKSAITDGKYARIYENPLTNFNNLQIFKDAVISLCQQLENN